MNTAGVFMFNEKEGVAEANKERNTMLAGRVGAVFLLALAVFLSALLCALAFYHGIRSSEFIDGDRVIGSGPINVIESIDGAAKHIPKLLMTYSLMSAVPTLLTFVIIMWIGAWAFERNTDRAAASFFFRRRVVACKEKLFSLLGNDDTPHSIVQVGAPALRCALHGFNLSLAAFFLIASVSVVAVAALTATGPYLIEEYGLYVVFLGLPIIGAIILLAFRPNIFRALYLVTYVALNYFKIFCINPVIAKYAFAWPPALLATFILFAAFCYICKSSLKEEAILISPKGLRVIEFSGSDIKEIVPCFVPAEVKVEKATSGAALSFKTPAGENMVLVPTVEKVLAFFTLTLGAGLDIKHNGADEVRSPIEEVRTEPLRSYISAALATACLFIALPVMRLSLYLGLCIIVAIAPFFGKDPKGVDVMIHGCNHVLKAIPREPVSLCFLWMAYNGKCEYDLADKQMQELQLLKDQMKIPKLWDVGQVGNLFSTIKKEADKRKQLLEREPAVWEPRKEGRRDFIIGAGLAANKISSLGIVSLDHQVSTLLLRAHRAEPSSPAPPVMLAYYLYSKPDFAVSGLSSIARSPKLTNNTFEYSPAGIAHKIRLFESSYQKVEGLLLSLEEKPLWRWTAATDKKYSAFKVPRHTAKTVA